MYLDGADPKRPLAPPLFGELAGLPPISLKFSSPEMQFSDSNRSIERAQAAGEDVTLEVWDRVKPIWHAAFKFLL